MLDKPAKSCESAENLVNRLFRFANKLGLRNEAAYDLALDAYTKSLSAGVPEWHFASVCLKNRFIENKRNRRRRNEDYKFTYEEGSSEPVELKTATVNPTQEIRAELNDVLSAVEKIAEPYRTAILLAAAEFTADEIACAMSKEKKEIYWYLQYARKLLRERYLHDLVPVRGHKKFFGIRKDHHRWSASIRYEGKYHYIGYFPDAESAAKAYDMKAIELKGKEAKTNFPLSIYGY